MTDEPPPNPSATVHARGLRPGEPGSAAEPTDEGEPLFLPDPYLLPSGYEGTSSSAGLGPTIPKPPAPRARLSRLALTSVLAALFLGPVGAILAILFGWYGRREVERAGGRRWGYALATLGMALGILLTPAWGGALSYLAWTRIYRGDLMADTEPEPSTAADPRTSPAAPPAIPVPVVPPAAPLLHGPLLGAPARTRVEHEGKITVVDLGRATASLSDELARQRAQATTAGETMVVMTLQGRCAPCAGVDQALRDPLMQTALARVRLVRVDVDLFREDLDGLRIPSERLPGFFLLAPDLSPRDGIDGGEWDADVAPNMAPVLGAFVRGKYADRRERWQPLPAGGMSL